MLSRASSSLRFAAQASAPLARAPLSRSFASKSLYVGNLPWNVSENELKSAINEFVPVQAVKIPLDRETGRPRGFAFVDLGSEEEAEKVIAEFHGKSFGGRILRVNEKESRPFTDRPPRSQ
ncbi:putative RNA-binding protein rbpE [Planoprotostelium fungivorum]|uniref:Putative RNA-binding protein rbpE n=1 Tax=Planoprotostelium fungivorum TaxID=1890364 RepID=A0A2P6NCP9_9EUKA|nr:putative RNA-binding protein rbpE [Planoprotostelium fungivorum]